MTDLVLRADRDGVATLTLHRPEVLNAISAECFRELRAHAEAIAGQGDAIGCVVLQGTGKSFCVGADLKAFKERKLADPDPTPFNRATMSCLARLPQPFIAAVHGHCLTGGLELALTADLIIAADKHALCRHASEMGPPRRLGADPAPAAPGRHQLCEGDDVLRPRRVGR